MIANLERKRDTRFGFILTMFAREPRLFKIFHRIVRKITSHDYLRHECLAFEHFHITFTEELAGAILALRHFRLIVMGTFRICVPESGKRAKYANRLLVTGTSIFGNRST